MDGTKVGRDKKIHGLNCTYAAFQIMTFEEVIKTDKMYDSRIGKGLTNKDGKELGNKYVLLNKSTVWLDGVSGSKAEDEVKNTIFVENRSVSYSGANVYDVGDTKAYIGDTFNCYLSIYQGDVLVATLGLPVYPQEFSDNNSGQFSEKSILGRSTAYQTYVGGVSRTISFTLSLHDEIVRDRVGVESDPDYDYIHLLVSAIESACYPGYDENGFVSPPSVELTIGDQFFIKGVVKNVAATWKAPMIDGKLTNCDVTVSITEISGPFDGNTIANSRGRR